MDISNQTKGGTIKQNRIPDRILKCLVALIFIFTTMFTVLLGTSIYQYENLTKELTQINQKTLKEKEELEEKIGILDAQIDDLKESTTNLEKENKELKAEIAQ